VRPSVWEVGMVKVYNSKRLAGVGLAMVAICLLVAACAAPVRVIGFIGPLTGPSANIGTEGLKGVRMRLGQINNEAESNGTIRIELQVHDDRGDPDECLKAMMDLQQTGVGLVMVHTTSGAARKALAQFDQGDMLVMTRTVSDPFWVGKDDMIVRFSTMADSFGNTIVQYMIEKSHDRRIVSIIDKANLAYGEAVFGSVFNHQQLQLVQKHTVTSTEDADAMATLVLSSKPDAVLACLTGAQAALFAQALDRRAFSGNLYLAPWAQDQNLLNYAGAFASNILIPSSFNPDDDSPAYLSFLDLFTQLYKEKPVMSAVYGYELADIAGRLVLANSDAKPRELRDRLLATEQIPTLQSTMKLDANGDVTTENFMLGIANGRFVLRP